MVYTDLIYGSGRFGVYNYTDLIIHIDPAPTKSLFRFSHVHAYFLVKYNHD